MKYLILLNGTRRWVVSTIAMLLLLVTFSASAQGVLAGAQTGTIQVEAQDDGFLTISGQNFDFRNGISLVFLNGQQVGDEALDEGLVVRYTLNRDGVLARIEILGPLNMIQALEDN